MSFETEQYLRELAGQAASNNYDTTENYDLTENQMYEAVEIENYIATVERKPRTTARRVAERVVRNPAAVAAIKQKMQRAGFAAGFTPAGIGGGAPSVANFDMVITRSSANITSALPVPIWGAFDVSSGFQGVLGSYLPAGVTVDDLVVGGVGADSTRLAITYAKTVGGSKVTDTLYISLNQYDYPSFLTGLTTSKFLISQIRLTIADTSATGLSQLNQTFDYVERSIFGAYRKDSFPLNSAKSPFQYQNGIIDINGTFNVTAQNSWVLMFQDNVDQTVTLNFSVAAADKGVI